MTDKQLAVLLKSYRYRLDSIYDNLVTELNKLDNIEYAKTSYDEDIPGRPVILNDLRSFMRLLLNDANNLDD